MHDGRGSLCGRRKPRYGFEVFRSKPGIWNHAVLPLLLNSGSLGCKSEKGLKCAANLDLQVDTGKTQSAFIRPKRGVLREPLPRVLLRELRSVARVQMHREPYSGREQRYRNPH